MRQQTVIATQCTYALGHTELGGFTFRDMARRELIFTVQCEVTAEEFQAEHDLEIPGGPGWHYYLVALSAPGRIA